MPQFLNSNIWQRKGISLLWDASAFAEIGKSEDIKSIHEFFQMVNAGWPDRFPCSNGDALVIAGLEALIDAVPPEEAENWLETELYPLLILFQQDTGSEAALIFWMPEAPRRLKYDEGKEVYLWHCSTEYNNQTIRLGRCLWNGVEKEASQILNAQNKYIGLYQARVS